jgi:hypothetical protein
LGELEKKGGPYELNQIHAVLENLSEELQKLNTSDKDREVDKKA